MKKAKRNQSPQNAEIEKRTGKRGKAKASHKEPKFGSFAANTAAKSGSTIAQTAKRIGLSVQRTTVLIDQGILPRAGRAGRDIDADTLLYCEHLRAQAAGRGDNAGSAALAAARSRWTAAKARAAELENQITDGLYVLASDVQEMMASTFADQRNMLLAVPGKVADRGQHTDRRELFDILSEEIREVLTRLCDPASYKFGDTR